MPPQAESCLCGFYGKTAATGQKEPTGIFFTNRRYRNSSGGDFRRKNARPTIEEVGDDGESIQKMEQRRQHYRRRDLAAATGVLFPDFVGNVFSAALQYGGRYDCGQFRGQRGSGRRGRNHQRAHQFFGGSVCGRGLRRHGGDCSVFWRPSI